MHEVSAAEWAPYAPIAGSPDFLKAVMDDLFTGEPELRAAACAVATPGGSGALRHAIANYLEPGQSLLTTSYFWGPYQTLADEASKTQARHDVLDVHGGRTARTSRRSTVKAQQRLITEQGRALLFINDPCQNPTGYSMRPAEWTALVDCLRAHAKKAPVTLLVDFAYAAYGAGDTAKPAVFTHLRPLLGEATISSRGRRRGRSPTTASASGALVACVPDAKDRAATEAALSYSCRGTWSNCSRGGLAAITKLLVDPEMRAACNAEREGFKALLRARVDAFNALARPRGLKYPRYEGGFFVTVFQDGAKEKADRMREAGVFVVPAKGALRIALCSVAEKDVARLVASLAG